MEEGLAAAKECQEPWLTASLLNGYGCVERFHQCYESALDYYQKSIELATEIGYEWLVSLSLHNIGTITRLQENRNQALKNFQQSLDVSLELGDNRSIATN